MKQLSGLELGCREFKLKKVQYKRKQYIKKSKAKDHTGNSIPVHALGTHCSLKKHFALPFQIYTDEATWDCVATCFFIDCANNIVDFIETIFKILKPGGYWVNLGPLLYHFADQPGERSIEPSYEEVKNILTGVGFKITVEETGMHTAYTQNVRSMLKYEYDSVFFVAMKP
ncbi:carnosine N-methyltransferase-like [Penaeus indicus]|uniref:carnosine N-methyltransferase-like n=1 Tax=Penaeus indicus TaxID=29960 RepID=UPI00300D4F99